MVLLRGIITWYYHVVLSRGIIMWYYHVVLWRGIITWLMVVLVVAQLHIISQGWIVWSIKSTGLHFEDGRLTLISETSNNLGSEKEKKSRCYQLVDKLSKSSFRYSRDGWNGNLRSKLGAVTSTWNWDTRKLTEPETFIPSLSWFTQR